MVQPFSIQIPPLVISDLQSRLSSTRWIDEIDNDDWETGANKDYLKRLCQNWQTDFDWNEQQNFLNTFDHYKTVIDDFDLHFIHQKGRGSYSIPLLLTHGFPDTFFRFIKLIPLLNAADADGFSFVVIIPSIPGYGFSQKPTKKGMDLYRVAKLFTRQIHKLGYLCVELQQRRS